MEIVLVFSMFVILLAGVDKETYGGELMVNNISLFSSTWLLALLFSVVPLASKYFIKK